MKLSVEHHPPRSSSYRARRVESLFNADDNSFQIAADIPIEGQKWSIGVIVGPSGSGKTTLGRRLFGPQALHAERSWPSDRPIIDAIAPDGTFEAVTSALAAVGLGTVPAWLRPYHLLSNGEKFRADLARVLVDAPGQLVVDEFTSVVDRQIARIGANAFAKSWRRTGGQAVLLTCHYDVLDWLEPDWVLDTTPNAEGQTRFTARWLRCGTQSENWYQRPSFELEVRQVDSTLWPLFAPHYYLTLPRMVAVTNYAAFVDGEPVAHVAFSTRMGLKEARASRLVVMPEWQGAGVGMRFLNSVCDLWRRGENRYARPMPTLFHTSHPGLAATLRRDPKWTQVSAALHGADRSKCVASLQRSAARGRFASNKSAMAGYGGHFRALQGFRYLGEEMPPCG
jgi:ABC-type ATPase involved in cell division/GNAT superfamily N-acetyltransferase